MDSGDAASGSKLKPGLSDQQLKALLTQGAAAKAKVRCWQPRLREGQLASLGHAGLRPACARASVAGLPAAHLRLPTTPLIAGAAHQRRHRAPVWRVGGAGGSGAVQAAAGSVRSDLVLRQRAPRACLVRVCGRTPRLMPGFVAPPRQLHALALLPPPLPHCCARVCKPCQGSVT